MDTKGEAQALLREAKEEVKRALRGSGISDWVTVTRSAQLAIEKSAKAIISCFEAYEWSHDPSEQLRKLIGKGLLDKSFLDIASYAEDSAPWHGASTYGERKNGCRRSPSEVCTQNVGLNLLDKAKKAALKASEFLEKSLENEQH